MNFVIDKLTINDLEIFGDLRSNNSIFSFYNQTITAGGKDYLLFLMENPITDLVQLKQRTELIRYFSSFNIDLKINYFQFDFIDTYLRLNIPTLRNNLFDAFFQNLSYKLWPENEYYIIKTGIEQIVISVKNIVEIINILNDHEIPEGLKQHIENLNYLINTKDFNIIKTIGKKISYKYINHLDYLFRKKHKNELHKFVQTIYFFDAFISVSRVSKTKRLAVPEYIDSNSPVLTLKKFYHPLLTNAVPYDIDMNESNSLCLLTGPNMAGKSTFLKSLALTIYLSHLGFPVCAENMKTSIYNGIITTINLADNIKKGYSHFYSEVRRVKEAALKLKEKNRLFVVFDELFRGTNVKDAYDASLQIIESFARIRKSTFFISTHITEIAERLSTISNIDYKYFDSELIDDKPVYNYILKNGLSHDRLGMYIVRNEKIFEILNSIDEN